MTTCFIFQDDGYENQQFLAAIEAINYTPQLIVAENIFYKYTDSRARPFYYDGQSLFVDGNIAMFRVLNNARSFFAKNLNYTGVNTVDPPERFTTNQLHKAATAMGKFWSTEENIPTTYIAFSMEGLRRHLHLIEYPVVYKPVVGSHGEGMELIENQESLLQIVANHRFNGDKTPVLLQRYIRLKREYRVICFNGRVISYLKKVIPVGTKKLFRGRNFEEINELPDNVRTYLGTYAKTGLVGIDIAIASKYAGPNANKIFIFEQNRAMEFERMDSTLNQNTARLIMEAVNG